MEMKEEFSFWSKDSIFTLCQSHSRSVSDVPIKIQELAITISNTKSVYKINAQQWIEIGDDSAKVERNSRENPFGTDFMMQPNKLYKISFAGEQCQFSENSMLSVSKRFGNFNFDIFISRFIIWCLYAGGLLGNQNGHRIQLCNTSAKLINECKIPFQQMQPWMWWAQQGESILNLLYCSTVSVSYLAHELHSIPHVN